MVDIFPKYTYTKSGTYYFSKTVPRDLRCHYTRHRIVICLKTKSRHKADISSKTLLSKLENYWLGLRLTHSDIPAQHLLSANPSQESDAPTLLDALDLYLKVKASGRSEYFNTTARRNIDYVIKCLGCRPIDQYNSADAAKESVGWGLCTDTSTGVKPSDVWYIKSSIRLHVKQQNEHTR